MTIWMNVNLVGNIKKGALIAEARVRKAGKTVFVPSCDVDYQGGNLLAKGEVVGRYDLQVDGGPGHRDYLEIPVQAGRVNLDEVVQSPLMLVLVGLLVNVRRRRTHSQV